MKQKLKHRQFVGKDNKLIAEFIGLYDEISLDSIAGNIHSWRDAPFFFITEDSKEKVIEGIDKYSKYDTSWDWLMPVVSKCRVQSNSEDSHWEAIYYSLEGCDIDVTYNAVVEFIKDHNDGEQ